MGLFDIIDFLFVPPLMKGTSLIPNPKPLPYAKGLLKSIFETKVDPVKGSILMCKIAGGVFEHSGIYVGNGKVVELSGSGFVRQVSMSEFLNNGITRTGSGIYVACDPSDDPLHSYIIAKRAKKMLGTYRDYNFATDNCHQFTAGCITGDFDNPVNFFWMLNDLIAEELNYGESVKWHLCYGNSDEINLLGDIVHY